VIIPEVVLIQLSSWGWAHSCSKHVEDSNKHIIEETVRQFGYLPELYFIMSRSILLRKRNVGDKSCRGNQNRRFTFSNFFPLENNAFYEIMWKNNVERGWPQIIWRMRIACWMPKATDTHSEYVILIAFPLQQWMHERVSMLRYTHIASFVRGLAPQRKVWMLPPSVM
jgi:hypothetical protein